MAPRRDGPLVVVAALYRRLPVPPRIWSIAFLAGPSSDAPNASVGRLSVLRSLVTPGLPLEVTSDVENAGPGVFSGAAELLIDDEPATGSPQAVGPIPAGGRTPVHFRTSLSQPGSHLLAVRLLGGDGLAADDVSALPVQVTGAIPVLLVNGEPGAEPFSGETDFLRAALAPSDDETPQFRVRVIKSDALNVRSLEGVKVAVLANMERISAEQSAALGDFAEAGGGILVAPGDRTDATPFNDAGWMPARLGSWKGNAGEGRAVAHPAPRTFSGPLLAAFGRGDAPALAEANFFAFAALEPSPGSAVLGRLDTGGPWLVERSQGRGRILALRDFDRRGGWDPAGESRLRAAGTRVDLSSIGWRRSAVGAARRTADLPTGSRASGRPGGVEVETPGGEKAKAELLRGGGLVRARIDNTTESGVYRLILPVPPGGVMYGGVARDARESDMTPLDAAEAAKLAEGWPLQYVTEAKEGELGLFAAEAGTRHEVWRYLVLAVLGGCAWRSI